MLDETFAPKRATERCEPTSRRCCAGPLGRSLLLGALIGTGLMLPAKYHLIPWRVLAPDVWQELSEQDELQEPLIGLAAARLGLRASDDLDAARVIRDAFESCEGAALQMKVGDEAPRLVFECAASPDS